jgi:hypothetical protein
MVPITTTNNNIVISNAAVAGDSGVIRIGTAAVQVKNFQAGIRGVVPDAGDGIPVFISSTGQLGTAISLRSAKYNIQDIDENRNADIISKLIPRTFSYNNTTNLQYGMIIDEVEDLCPELIARTSEGKQENLNYHFIPTMLLKEVQRLGKIVKEQGELIKSLQK